MTPDEYLDGSQLGHQVFEEIRSILSDLDDVEVRTTKSQIAFRRRRGFAYVWLPGKYLSSPQAEVVLSLPLGRRVDSARFKEVAHPSPHLWQHHLEIRDLGDIDGQVRDWLREAYDSAE